MSISASILAIGLDPEDFPRIHNVVRVDRLLGHTHNVHSMAVLSNQKVYLAATDTELANAGAVERQRPVHHSFAERGERQRAKRDRLCLIRRAAASPT